MKFLTVGVVTGALAWCGVAAMLPIASIPFALLPYTKRRTQACALMLGYFLGASWFIPSSVVAYGASSYTAPLFWILPCLCLSLPFGVLWSERSCYRVFGVFLSLLFISVPPLSSIGIANPLLGAGILFPGLGFLGLFLMLSILLALTYSAHRTVRLLCILVCLIPYTCFQSQTYQNALWQAVNLKVPMEKPLSPSEEFQWVQMLFTLSERQKAKFIIFPESILNYSEQLLWLLEAKSKTIPTKHLFIGMHSPTTNENAVVHVHNGSVVTAYTQRQPIPYFGALTLNPFGYGHYTNIPGEHLAFLQCYEQFLFFQPLLSFIEKPTIIIAQSNIWWDPLSPISAIQQASIISWSKLFSIPFVYAVNKPLRKKLYATTFFMTNQSYLTKNKGVSNES